MDLEAVTLGGFSQPSIGYSTVAFNCVNFSSFLGEKIFRPSSVHVSLSLYPPTCVCLSCYLSVAPTSIMCLHISAMNHSCWWGCPTSCYWLQAAVGWRPFSMGNAGDFFFLQMIFFFFWGWYFVLIFFLKIFALPLCFNISHIAFVIWPKWFLNWISDLA